MNPNLANPTIHSFTTTNPMTPELLNELRSFLVERLVDNMSTKDLVEYVTDDIDEYYDGLTDSQFIIEAQNYWEDSFDEVVEEIEDYMKCDFKKDRREDDDLFIDINNTGGKY